MPERFLPCKALYKCSDFTFYCQWNDKVMDDIKCFDNYSCDETVYTVFRRHFVIAQSRWRRGHIRRQTVPDADAGNRKGSCTDFDGMAPWTGQYIDADLSIRRSGWHMVANVVANIWLQPTTHLSTYRRHGWSPQQRKLWQSQGRPRGPWSQSMKKGDVHAWCSY